MTILESALSHCAFMILHDQCPPDNKHYLCKKMEDDSIGDCCAQRWNNYLFGLTMGTIELPRKERRTTP